MRIITILAALSEFVLLGSSFSIPRIVKRGCGGDRPSLVEVSSSNTAGTDDLSSGAPQNMSPPVKGHVFIAVTLDGKIAEVDGSVDFLNEYQGSASGDDMGFSRFMDSVDAILMGRNSFDKVVSFGEQMWCYGSKPVVVWTRSIESVVIPAWLESKGTVTCSSLSPKDLFDHLGSKGIQNVYVDGGKTIQKFLSEGLIHAMDITTVPIILGSGIALFDDQSAKVSMRHLQTKAYENGLVQSRYDKIS